MTKQLKKAYQGIGEIKGYTLNQITENENGFIYEKKHAETGNISYEVFKRKVNKYFNCISYPTSKAFGVWAWECATLERAKERLNSFHKQK